MEAIAAERRKMTSQRPNKKGIWGVTETWGDTETL